MAVFKDSITATQLKNYGEELSQLAGKEAIQVLHRGAEVKVIITQEFFFHLLATYNTAYPPAEEPRLAQTPRDKAKAKAKGLLKEQNETSGKKKSADDRSA